ncbi:DUF226 domain-containing protein [Borreliella burgdorferi]|uniref:DUF226 domain-containing protein n=1 Tax=Borreliella burgdorferi TaxID=139 RepID=UPI000D036FCE
MNKTTFFKYEDIITKTIKTVPMYKIHYIEFRFKKGSVFLLYKSNSCFNKKEKFKKNMLKSIRENN